MTKQSKQRDINKDARQTLELNGYEVQIFDSEIDGKTVVQIDGPDEDDLRPPRMSEHGQPILRVYLNDARLWEGYQDGHEETGDN